jgi:hypothetical protein
MMLEISQVGYGEITDGPIEEIQELGCARTLTVCGIEPILAEPPI